MPRYTVGEFREKSASIAKITHPEAGALDIYTAFKVSTFAEAFAKEFLKVEKAHKDIFLLYGSESEDKQTINVPIEKLEEFNKAMGEFQDGEVVLPNFHPDTPIPISRLTKCNLTPTDLIHLGDLVVGEEEPSK